MQAWSPDENTIGRVGGLILAAGASRRMGRDKAMLEVNGHSFLEHCVAGLAPWCGQIAIVLGFHAEAIETAAWPRLENGAWAGRLIWTRNSAPERGQFSSLQSGLQALDAGNGAVIVCPVDHPLFQPSTIAALIAAWRGDADAAVVKPAFQGRHGHPVLYGGEAVQALREAAPGATARDVQTRFAAATRIVDVDDAGIGWNLDTPEELRRVEESGS